MRASTSRLVLLGIVLAAISMAAPARGSVFATPSDGSTLPRDITTWDELTLTFPGEGVTDGPGPDINFDFTANPEVEIYAWVTTTDGDEYSGSFGPFLFSQGIDLAPCGLQLPVTSVRIFVDWGEATLNAVEGYYPLFTPVTIDIKPGNGDNVVNLGSQGVVPVAILSTAAFDATQVDPVTVTLSGASVALRGNGKNYLTQAKDVNNDGLVDLVLDVETENLDPGIEQSGTAVLTGSTYAGQAIQGSDHITVVPPQ